MTHESETLCQVGLRILSDWGMMLVDEAPKNTEIFEADQPLYMAWVNMRGAKKGTLSIVAQPAFMENLARNLLGLDGGTKPSDEEQKDAFRELGNVLAGNFFTAAFGEETVFDLIYPTVVEVEKAQVDGLKKKGEIYSFLADDAPVSMTFSTAAD